MKQPKYSPEESLKRMKLMMGYDPSTTLTENQQKIKTLITEDESQSEKAFRKVVTACTGRAETEGTIDAASVAAALNRSFNYTWGTEDSVWRAQAAIMKKGNFDDFCNIVKEYEETFGESLADGVIGDLDDEEIAEFMEAIAAMKYKSNKMSKLAVASTEQYNINWFKKQFPCIFETDGNVDSQVRKNQNNYVYILIKGTSGAQYQVYSDGRVKKTDGTSTGKKVACSGSKVTFINESIQKKNLVEQIDDSELTGGRRTPSPSPSPSPRPRPKRTSSLSFSACTEEMPIEYGCQNNTIKRIQVCLGLPADGKFGPNTRQALINVGDTGNKIDGESFIKACKPNSPKEETPKKETPKFEPDDSEESSATDILN
jgi:murein L,D-transpeptidase YcbB/YkuD